MYGSLYNNIFIKSLVYKKNKRDYTNGSLNHEHNTGKVLTKIWYQSRSYASVYSTTYAVKPLFKKFNIFAGTKGKKEEAKTM